MKLAGSISTFPHFVVVVFFWLVSLVENMNWKPGTEENCYNVITFLLTLGTVFAYPATFTFPVTMSSNVITSSTVDMTLPSTFVPVMTIWAFW